MKFFELLENYIKEKKLEVIGEEAIINELEVQEYIKDKDSWKKTINNNEIDYFNLNDIRLFLKRFGFKKDRKFKFYYRNNDGKEYRSEQYRQHIYELGAERYCLEDMDDYLDDPRIKLKGCHFHYKMFEEIEKFSKERGLDFDYGLEYIVLEYFKKERTQDTYLKELIEELDGDSGYYNKEEKNYLINLYKKDKEYFKSKNYLYHLDDFYIEELKRNGIEDFKINQFKDVNDVEFLGWCYLNILKCKEFKIEELKKFYYED